MLHAYEGVGVSCTSGGQRTTSKNPVVPRGGSQGIMLSSGRLYLLPALIYIFKLCVHTCLVVWFVHISQMSLEPREDIGSNQVGTISYALPTVGAGN